MSYHYYKDKRSWVWRTKTKISYKERKANSIEKITKAKYQKLRRMRRLTRKETTDVTDGTKMYLKNFKHNERLLLYHLYQNQKKPIIIPESFYSMVQYGKGLYNLLSSQDKKKYPVDNCVFNMISFDPTHRLWRRTKKHFNI
jgi:hypothetical protein